MNKELMNFDNLPDDDDFEDFDFEDEEDEFDSITLPEDLDTDSESSNPTPPLSPVSLSPRPSSDEQLPDSSPTSPLQDTLTNSGTFSNPETQNTSDGQTSNSENNFIDTPPQEQFTLVGDEISIKRENFTLESVTVPLHTIAIPKPIKDARAETYQGLSKSVQEMGVLVPIFLTPTESYLRWLDEGNDSSEVFSGPRYRLLDGLRRLYAGHSNNLEEIPAVIVKFHHPEMASSMGNLFSRILNTTKNHSWAEIWNLMQVLEGQYSLTPLTLEWLLRIERGDSHRLREVMLCDYEDIKSSFLEGKKNLQQAYNALQKALKEEDSSSLEDQMGISPIEGTENIIGDHSEGKLSPTEVKEILDMVNSSSDLTDSDFGGDSDMFGGDADTYVQDTKHREKLSPELRTSILKRDEFSCQICGFGKNVVSTVQLGLLECHHITAVYTGGNDSKENFVTACTRCHSLIHILAGFNGKIGMTPEEFDKLPEQDQTMFRNAVRYAKALLAAEKASGKSLKKFKPARNPFWKAQQDAQDIVSVLQDNPS